MAMELIGVQGMTSELKQTYERTLLSVLEKNLVFAKYGLNTPIPARGGKSVEWRRFEKITVGTHVLTEGTPPTETQATISAISATISQYGAYSKVSDLLELQSFDPVIDGFSRAYGRHMAEVLDVVVRDQISAGATTVQYAGAATVVGTSGAGAVGSGNYLDSAELLEAKRTLTRVDVRPINGRYICLIHPDNTKDLYQDSDIIAAFKDAAERGAGNPLSTGVLGDWMGIRFVESTNIRLRTSYGMSGADVYECYLVGEEAYGITDLSADQAKIVVKPRGSGGTSDPLNQFSTVGWKAAIAAKVLDVSRLVKIYCASSRTPSA